MEGITLFKEEVIDEASNIGISLSQSNISYVRIFNGSVVVEGIIEIMNENDGNKLLSLMNDAFG